MDRRNFTKVAAAVVAMASVRAAAQGLGTKPTTAGFAGIGPQLKPGEKPFQIAMLIFDNMTNQDFVGPHDIFSRVGVAQIDVIGKTRNLVRTDARGHVLPDIAISEAKEHYDLIFVPGGGGTTGLMEDAETIEFLQTRGAKAQFITSVCTGALVLGAAGLLDGYRAATHWAAMDILPLLGAIPEKKRWVFDRNRLTGGGVTAGIDFGLAVVGKLWGDQFAQLLQLGMEYDPQPPYDMGSPEKASPEVLALGRKMTARLTEKRTAVARRIQAARKRQD